MTDDVDLATIVPGRYDNLMVSRDTGEDDKPIAVLTHTPDMQNTVEHSHIPIDVGQAKKLRDWLDRFIDDKSSCPACRPDDGLQNLL